MSYSITDPLELMFAKFLDDNGILYTRPDRDPHDRSTLDFYLTDLGLSVEVKSWSSERLHNQLRGSGREQEGILVIIGIAGVIKFQRLIDSLVFRKVDHGH